MVLLVFSFPTVNYSSAILTDGIGFFFFVSAIFLLQKKQIFLFSLIVAIGVLTREANLSALVVFFVYLIFAKRWGCSQHGWSIYLLTILPSILVYALVRFAFRAIPSYFWYPSIERFADNVTRPISWITVLLTILPLLGLSFFGLYQKNFQISFASTFSMHEHALLRSLLIVGILFFSYSVTSAFMSGRFIWPFYTILIPFTILCMRQTWPLNSRTISGD